MHEKRIDTRWGALTEDDPVAAVTRPGGLLRLLPEALWPLGRTILRAAAGGCGLPHAAVWNNDYGEVRYNDAVRRWLEYNLLAREGVVASGLPARMVYRMLAELYWRAEHARAGRLLRRYRRRYGALPRDAVTGRLRAPFSPILWHRTDARHLRHMLADIGDDRLAVPFAERVRRAAQQALRKAVADMLHTKPYFLGDKLGVRCELVDDPSKVGARLLDGYATAACTDASAVLVVRVRPSWLARWRRGELPTTPDGLVLDVLTDRGAVRRVRALRIEAPEFFDPTDCDLDWAPTLAVTVTEPWLMPDGAGWRLVDDPAEAAA